LLFKNLQFCALAFDYRVTETKLDDTNPLKVLSTSSLVLWSGVNLAGSFSHTDLYLGSAIFIGVIYILFTIAPGKYEEIAALTA